MLSQAGGCGAAEGNEAERHQQLAAGRSNGPSIYLPT